MVEAPPPPDPAKETPEPPTPRGDLIIACRRLRFAWKVSSLALQKREWSPFGAVVAGLPFKAPSRNGFPLLLMAKHGLERASKEKAPEPPTPGGDLLSELRSCKALMGLKLEPSTSLLQAVPFLPFNGERVGAVEWSLAVLLENEVSASATPLQVCAQSSSNGAPRAEPELHVSG